MSSRMDKYYENNDSSSSRFQRHTDLYKEINRNELENYEVKSNATIIGENKNEIDVEKIKKILDTKYNSGPQRKSIRLDEEEEKEEVREETKEYDINVVLEKAKEHKEENYEEERLKQLRNTQFDILNNLNVDKEEVKQQEEKEEKEDEKLKSLIDTISFNEHKHEANTALDILSDLKGSDNTEVLEGLKDEVDEYEKTLQTEIIKDEDILEEDNKLDEDEVEKEEKEEFDNTKMVNSFYTTSNVIKDKDFEDLDDFANIESNNTVIKIIISVVVIVFLVGIALLVRAMYFS